MNNYFDTIVIGGGHAAVEAAHAAARAGASTLMITMNMDHIAQMSCNPAVGGIAKGQVVREIDALGGVMGKITDASSIQFRMLNRTKGPAVWSPRSQCDKVCYQRAMKYELERTPSLMIHQAKVVGFVTERETITGVLTSYGETIYAKSIILAPGTFLTGKLHYGMSGFSGGRAGDPPSNMLPAALRDQLGLQLGRLKTGTPPRVLAKTISFSNMERQESEICDESFSFFPEDKAFPQTSKKDIPCWTTRTTRETAEIVRRNIERSPLYQGVISGIGTRYCPSFEDKVMRFPHHETHIIYLEPEGECTEEFYLNGISTSLPTDVQNEMIASIPGLEKAFISRYAYAIEYDFVFPHQIERSLAVRKWRNLFLAGQINGTSGYEEAAGQGLVAGLNAARTAAGLDLVELGRDTSYIGVMIDDLVTKDILEPYRLFTSRAEYRLTLRQDNANLRLCPIAEKLGILPSAKFAEFSRFREKYEQTLGKSISLSQEGMKIPEHLRRMNGILSETPSFPTEMLGIDMLNREDRIVLREVVVHLHYEGYLVRENKSIEKLKKLEEWHIPEDFDYSPINGLKTEAKTKLTRIRPSTLAQASRIDGVTPAEISLLQVLLKKMGKTTQK